jgi:hypothetical protein
MDDTSKFAEVFMIKDEEPNLVFNVGSSTEMVRITQDGFYVRGVRVPADENEAATVYKAFKRWLVEAELRRPY